MKKIIAYLIFNSISFFSFSQGQANIWHFGNNAGIDFNSGIAVAINGPVQSSEGCATISNASGNLLFSTNGYWAYNTAGNLMGAMAMFGDISSTQTALIVPFPGNSNKYYIFTTPITDFAGGSAGFNYSVIDMTLNGGLGGFESVNTNLHSSSCEKLTGTRNTNGTDYWIIMHAYPTNEFYVYPVTASGIGTPVISAIGLSSSDHVDTHGYLKCSPNGQKLASARLGSANDPIELFDFNPSNGVISNYDSIPSAFYDYGLSFSPDNSKLYVNSGFGGPTITQYDLTISNFQNFPYIVFQGGVSYGALQLAPDGKIYFANDGENNLGVINNPNLAGAACNFIDSGFILLSGTTSTLGLPNFIDSHFESTGSDVQTVTSAANNMGVIPNPCTNCEIIGVENANDLTVTDILGRKQNATFSKSGNGFTIQLAESANGIYLIRNSRTGEVVKFVKE